MLVHFDCSTSGLALYLSSGSAIFVFPAVTSGGREMTRSQRRRPQIDAARANGSAELKFPATTTIPFEPSAEG